MKMNSDVTKTFDKRLLCRVAESQLKCPTLTATFPKFPTPTPTLTFLKFPIPTPEYNVYEVWLSTIF